MTVHNAAGAIAELCTGLWTEVVDRLGVSVTVVTTDGCDDLGNEPLAPCPPKGAEPCRLTRMSTTVLTALAGVLAAAEGEGRELPMPTWLYGVIAFALFLVGLALVWAFRGSAQKYAREGDDRAQPFHGTHPGAGH